MCSHQFPLISNPNLLASPLSFRLGLCRGRTAAYPLDRMDFLLMDLERPADWHRHADWCTGDLSGRVLEFLSAAEGIDGKCDERLDELFGRIWRMRRPSGLFGRYATWPPQSTQPPEENFMSVSLRLFNGLIRYYDLTGDQYALDGAVGMGDWALTQHDEIIKHCATHFQIFMWITEPLANLYRLTGQSKYLDLAAQIIEPVQTIEYCHSHGALTTLRGLQLAALYTGDSAWNEKPERFRREIIDCHYQMADGCIAETFPRSFRNEGCSIADWIMLNLNAGLLTGDDKAYETAENAMWNALFFNQFITGGFGHRDLTLLGYDMGPMSECWWCCTENGGLAMTEYARHTVSLRDNTVSVNLLTPGVFRLPCENGEIEVEVQTCYPATAEATITMRNVPEIMQGRLRIPSCIRNARVDETRNGRTLELRLTGRLGHHLQSYQDKFTLRYGPLVLSPMVYYWGREDTNTETNVPPGYIPASFPAGTPQLDVGLPDEDGLLNLKQEPLPDWIYFEQGPPCPISISEAPASVPVRFENGQQKTLWFTPLCHITSDMSYYETPILFNH